MNHVQEAFSHRSWRRAEALLLGAILVSGRRTVTSILRIAGLMGERRFVNYHHCYHCCALACCSHEHPHPFAFRRKRDLL